MLKGINDIPKNIGQSIVSTIENIFPDFKIVIDNVKLEIKKLIDLSDDNDVKEYLENITNIRSYINGLGGVLFMEFFGIKDKEKKKISQELIFGR